MVNTYYQIYRCNSYSDLFLPFAECYRQIGEHWSLIDSLSKKVRCDDAKKIVISFNSCYGNCMFHKIPHREITRFYPVWNNLDFDKSCHLLIYTVLKRFLLRIFPVNVTKFTVSCKFGPIYWENSYWKTSFFVQIYLEWCAEWYLEWCTIYLFDL